MTLKEALKILNIEDYGERIFHSNSRGELFHCNKYVKIAKTVEGIVTGERFREAFIELVDSAKDWKRPQSIYQHVPEIIGYLKLTDKECDLIEKKIEDVYGKEI